MNQDILMIPIERGIEYIGKYDVLFKAGNQLTEDWEVITVPLLEGVSLAVYNRDIASILIHDIDIGFQWNEEIRRLISNYKNILFVDFLLAIKNNKM